MKDFNLGRNIIIYILEYDMDSGIKGVKIRDRKLKGSYFNGLSQLKEFKIEVVEINQIEELFLQQN